MFGYVASSVLFGTCGCLSVLFVAACVSRNGKLLGKGGFGTVRVVTHKETQNKYALKVRCGAVRWCGMAFVSFVLV